MMSRDTIHTLFETIALASPNNVAVVHEEVSLTYRELNEKANQYGHYLREMGVRSDDPVALCMERSVDLLIIMMGILKAGGVYVPLDPAHPESRLLYTLNDNSHPILIINEGLEAKFSRYQGKLLVVERTIPKIAYYPTHNLDTVVTPHHLAYVIYTSGSTGKPKGVLIEHQSVVNYGLWFASYSGCQAQQRIDFSSNYIFDMAVTTSIVALMLGLTIVICHDEVKRAVKPYLDYLQQSNIQIIKMTPSYFKALLLEVKNNRVSLPDLKTMILGGENLLTVDCSAWLALYPEHRLFNEYGPTEATVGVCQFQVENNQLATMGTSVPIGKPGPNMDCYLLDDANKLVADGEVGELYLGGVCLAQGYLNQPELSRQKFISSPIAANKNSTAQILYRTGDLCRRLPDGMLEYFGRVDMQVKIRGFRVEPGEIERCIVEYPSIKDAVVFAYSEEGYENRLVAYYILDNVRRKPSVRELREYLERYLPEYMIPTAFVPIDAFPLTANGKLDRSLLPVPCFTSVLHHHEPYTELEKTLVEIWSEELGVKGIGVDDHFIELGGHSLSAARIISTINALLSKEVSLHDFYEAATIQRLAIVVENTAEHLESKSNSKLSTHNHQIESYLPLSDFQLLLWLTDTFEPKARRLNIVAAKRFQGPLNLAALQFAFDAVLKKQEVLFYHVFKLRPAQQPRKKQVFELVERNLHSIDQAASRAILDASLTELTYYDAWRKDSPLLMARLFHLNDERAELQCCMPHLISDDVSLQLLLVDLSKFYFLYHEQATISAVDLNQRYRDYLYQEQDYAVRYGRRDLAFWDDYLKDACLFRFPTEQVLTHQQMQKQAYSTYVEMPEQGVKNLQQFCLDRGVNINDSVCAVLGMALINCCKTERFAKQAIVMNVIKSTRDNPIYDETIGCFLRLEPIKFSLSSQSHLISLLQQISQSRLVTAMYQRCSSIVKLGSISTFRQSKKIIQTYFVQSLLSIYALICRRPKLNHQLLKLLVRLSAFERRDHFLININIRNNFIQCPKDMATKRLFGLKLEKINRQQSNLLEIESCFEVCFLRDDCHDRPYVVISANLRPDFREELAQELIRLICEDLAAVSRKTPVEMV